ncbi:MAG: ADP-ribosylglycohydrolase family protein, partial [Bdellovibrionales bacterium]|nr:ADP-ribosylglycohydrolase family protein [Bdellovibrionales bacterium]
IEAMYDVINSGGDTDSTAAMVGALLGALNGGDILPEGLIANTQEIEALLKQEEAFACTLSL